MKKLVLAIALLTGGCMTSNQYGSCKGFITKDEKDPKLNYEVSTRNVVLSVIFGGPTALLWPVVTGAFWLWCPEGKK